MNFGRSEARPSRAFVQLLALTGVSAASAYLREPTFKLGFAIVVAVVAVSKVRLVVLDFLGRRRDGSPIGAALIAWAAGVLAIALGKAVLLAMAS
ncbi:hypothetical protein [Rhizobium hidalgonense]|uniref:hypothetical protein n=1 Tax=Rhizobium hidalgonense TaxID=1538159 RepID=UPI002871581B|nr:hypothetical protein [Rhizobium hidalgonense]MDR9808468.1 hypothetical protein [Rhizobium hidalgonense]